MPFKRNIRLMYIISFIQGMVFYVSISTLYRKVCGVTVFQMTVIESISLALSMILEIPWGLAAERIGYKKALVICSFLAAFAKYIFYIADGFRLFLLERIVLAFVLAGLSGVDTSILYISCGENNAQKVFGIYTSLSSAGMMIASAIFSLLPEGSYRLAALLTLIAYSIAAVLSLFIAEVKGKPAGPSGPFTAFKSAVLGLKNIKGLVPLLIMNALLFETLHNITVFFSQLQYSRGGASMSIFGIATIIGSMCEMSGGLSDRLTRFFGERRFGTVIILLCAAGCFTMAFTSNLIISVATVSIMYAACALMAPLTAVIENRMITSDDRATMLSVNSMLTACLSIPLNLIVGRIVDIDLTTAFIFCGVLIVFSCFLFTKSLKR